MAVHIRINGNEAGDGFLLAPLDSNYDAQIELWVDAGSETVTLNASPNPAALSFSGTGPFNITTVPTVFATVHSTVQSATRGDTTIQVLDSSPAVVASFNVTSIRHATINFRGRFEARFATDGAEYNKNPKYTSDPNSTVVPPGWTWILEGEPDFVPAVGNVPVTMETTGTGRAIRLNNPVSLRSHADPVVSTVVSISGSTTSGTETFPTGDPLIGLSVNFGPNTYFAGNQPNPGATTEEFWSAQREPLALFQINFGNASTYLRGSSAIGPFDHNATVENEVTRNPDSRPKTPGVVSSSTLRAEIGLPDMQTFSATRIDLLIADWSPLGAGTAKRNLARRIGHLLSAVTPAKRTAVQNANPGAFVQRPGNITWDAEVYTGKVDADLHAQSNGSSVIEYMKQFFSFDFNWSPFSFHSDELCGYHKGSLKGDETMTGNHIGDPHTRTVNGKKYDFQSIGEFILLRDGNDMEIQVRQSPVATANPITDPYSGLTACVSIITAVAVRLGSHRISFQPGREGRLLQFYVDGKPAELTRSGINLGGSRVTGYDVDGQMGLRVDFKNGTVMTAAPHFWNSNNVWYINVSVSNTRAVEGIMGYIPGKSWLPRLRNGQDVGPLPASLHDRYVVLYKIFADSWRVDDNSSLFVYAQGTSTKTFTDPDWPAEQAPCNMKAGFYVGEIKIFPGMAIDKAKLICKVVTDDDLHQNCVFDVATTGDETLAQGYIRAQRTRHTGTVVKIAVYEAAANLTRAIIVAGDQPPLRASFVAIATVSALTPGKGVTKGTVTYFVNDKEVGAPVPIDSGGNAKWNIEGLDKGTYEISAVYTPYDDSANDRGVSPVVKFTLPESSIQTGGGNGKPKGGSQGRYWWWLLLLLLILFLIWWFFFRN